MSENVEWDLSSKEQAALRQALSSKISMVELFGKHSRSIESIASTTWTHKCICPNPNHKGGDERTPSCCFSEASKEFYCFGCQQKGDAFDLMAMMSNKPANQIAEEWGAKENVDVSQLEAKQVVSQTDVIRIIHKLSIILRDYLVFFIDTPCYNEETIWVDHEFRKIDDRFAKIDKYDSATARQVYAQVLMDLERRKTQRITECK